MKLFECQVCRHALYFETARCDRCGHRLGYIPQDRRLAAFEPAGQQDDSVWAIAREPQRLYRFCRNAGHGVCNWVVAAERDEGYCGACRHNRTIPDLSWVRNRALWRMMEIAKHRLFYTLIDLSLPLVTRLEDPEEGLMFDFLEDTLANKRVVTGHSRGRITINIAEADDAERERRRTALGEPYRTLLGHFRHEIGHWYWSRLVRDRPAHAAFRILFGDERVNYRQSLRRHYDDGAPDNWSGTSVTAYGTSHPWEDFAETFAHYLHMVDALDTARAFGIGIHPPNLADGDALSTDIAVEPHHAGSITPLIQAWLPLTFAVNSLNRSLGQTDFYPFTLSPAVVDKLGFVHDLVHGRVGDVPRSQTPLDASDLPSDAAGPSSGPFAEHPSR